MSERLIGVDVGGTKISVAVLAGGELSEPHLEETSHEDADALLEQIVAAVQRAAGDDDYAAVGLGVPSVIDWDTGTVRSSVNIPLRDVPVRQVLRERLGVPVYVDNDGNCAALAEAHAEDGSLATRHLVMFTVGTGIGGGLVVDGRVFRGATGAAPELGHWIVGADLETGDPERVDAFPQPGSLEALSAGRALHALAGQHGFGDGHEALRAAREGDERGVEVLSILGRRLGIGIANAINAFDPEVVAVGGGISIAGDLLLEPARETALRFVLPGVGTGTQIRLARSGPEAGVRGAALLAGQELAIEAQNVTGSEPMEV